MCINDICWAIFPIEKDKLPILIIKCNIIDIKMINGKLYYKVDEPVEYITKEYLLKSENDVVQLCFSRLLNFPQSCWELDHDILMFRDDNVEYLNRLHQKYNIDAVSPQSYPSKNEWYNIRKLLEKFPTPFE